MNRNVRIDFEAELDPGGQAPIRLLVGGKSMLTHDASFLSLPLIGFCVSCLISIRQIEMYSRSIIDLGFHGGEYGFLLFLMNGDDVYVKHANAEDSHSGVTNLNNLVDEVNAFSSRMIQFIQMDHPDKLIEIERMTVQRFNEVRREEAASTFEADLAKRFDEFDWHPIG